MLNLLPIPVLDGGLILFSLIALVFRRRLPEKLTAALSTAFMYALMGLMGLLIFKDTVRSWKIHTYKPESVNVQSVQTNESNTADSRADGR